MDGRPLHFVTDPADAVVGAEIRRTGRWQEVETRLISALVGPGDHAVDAGAHIGYFTVVLAKRIGPSGRVRAFEPEQRNFALLKANCILNGCTNVELQPVALGARSGRGQLYLGQDNLGDHRLHPVAGREACAVDVVRLDDCQGGDRLDFLKLDTQGSEAAILSGAIETIRANADRLICLMEVSPRLSEAAGHGREEMLALLAGLGARAFTASLPPLPLEPLAVAALWDRLLAAEADDANEMIVLAFSPQAADRLGGGAG
ncbi:MAG: FkbM family methyltransferase [Geminicoccaceae bacterium]